jgi:methanogenic corrinoid protein MtbC1
MNNISTIATIASISLETGIAKEVLRKWEARYGFPTPERDAGGHRTYTSAQTARLKLIKRLIDGGLRPAQVVPLDEAHLLALLENNQVSVAPSVQSQTVRELIDALRSQDANLLREKAKIEIERIGLENFVLDVMPPLTDLVGEAWAKGDISIRDEHVYTEVMKGLLRVAISRTAKPDGSPRVLLTTPVGELHTLGILMVETVVSIQGGYCISLGAQTPLDEICGAVQDYRADIVGLSFSACFPMRKITPLLKELRAHVPQEIDIWAGGAGITALERKPRGIIMLPTLRDVSEALKEGRRRLLRDSSRIQDLHKEATA